MLYRSFLHLALPLLGGDRFAELRRFEVARRLLNHPGIDGRAVRIAYVGAPVAGRLLGFRRLLGKPIRRFGAANYRRASALALYMTLTDRKVVVLLTGFALLALFI